MSIRYNPGENLNPFVTTMPPAVHPRAAMSGSGSPEGRVKSNPGTGYTDTQTGHLWVKFAGVQALGWHDVGFPGPTTGGGGTTSAIQVFTGMGSPVGVVFPTTEAAYYTQQDSEPAGVIWSYYNGQWH